MFITIEGPDSVGKTVILKSVMEKLAIAGINAMSTREPGGDKISEQIRFLLLDNSNTDILPCTEALLFAAARAQHVEHIIKPALAEGKVVVCDRYIDSSYVYQGIVNKLGIDTIKKLNCFALTPDLTIVLLTDEETLIKRMEERGKINRLDNKSVDFHSEVLQAYTQLPNELPDRIYQYVDASEEIETVAQNCYEIIMKEVQGGK